MVDAQRWSGLTTKQHMYKIYEASPQKASKLLTRIYNENYGTDLDSYLDMFSPLYLDRDDDFTWDLIGTARKNVPLVEARLTRNGAAVSGSNQAGKNFGEFYLVFPEQWFTDVNIIVGHKNEAYPLQIQADPEQEGTYWVYRVKLITGDPNHFVPVEDLAPSTRWSKDWSLVEQTLSKKGGGIQFESPIKMRNNFSMIRMQHTTPGNMVSRPFMTAWKAKDSKGMMQTYSTWMQYQDWMFEDQFRQEKNKLLLYATSNRANDGTFKNFGKSGNILEQGAGIRQQMESANKFYYSEFTIDYLEDILVELAEGKLGFDERRFVLRTGERGATQFHRALESRANSWRPLYDSTAYYEIMKAEGKTTTRGFGYQFTEYMAPNDIIVSVQVDPLYSDRERNKIFHPDGGVAEAYRYDILDVGMNRMDGEPNIRKVYIKGYEDIYGYVPGFRDPYSPMGGKNMKMMADPTDGYTMHRGTYCGAMVKDPSRTAVLIPSILQGVGSNVPM